MYQDIDAGLKVTFCLRKTKRRASMSRRTPLNFFPDSAQASFPDSCS